MKLAIACFAFAGLCLLAGDDGALYAGAHLVGALVSGGIGLLIIASKADTNGGCLWLPLLAIFGLAIYLVANGG